MTNPAGQGADANADDDDSHHDIPKSEASDGAPPLDKQLTPGTIDQVGDATNMYVPGIELVGELSLNGELALESFGVETNDVPIPAKLGKYHIKGQIGRGGMGIVWKALDPDLQRTVAIKILSPHLAQSAVARRRFQREARAAAAISHPNVLTIHSVEEQGNMPFLVMEFVSGNSLREYVTEQGKLDALEVIRLGTQIALGLAAAHAGGVIHRDVKPANVMLHEGATRVRLMDFGLARVAFDNADLTSHDHTVGTPAYMAPEQVRGSQIDARADLFSLGCVLYYMATGYSPFHGKSQAETIHKILDHVPTTLAQLFPGTSPVLSELVEKLLAKNPDDRFQSSLEVADILRQLQSQLNLAQTDELLDVLRKKSAPSLGPNERPSESTPTTSPKPSASMPVRAARVLVPLVVFLVGAWGLNTFWTSKPTLQSAAQTQGGKPVGESSKTETPNTTKNESAEPTLPKLARITVGPGPNATCATLSEAIRRAAENCEITVSVSEPITESLVIEGAGLNGLKLKASPRAVWRCSEETTGETQSLLIKNVSQVELAGFDFEVQPEMGRAVNLTGTVGDVSLTDCGFRHLGLSHNLSLVNIGAARETPESRVLLQNCRFSASAGKSFCLATDAKDKSSPRIECLDSIFESQDRHVLFSQTCGAVRLAGNVFVGGHTAIHMHFKPWSGDERFEITNNTFVGARYWFSWMDSFPSKTANLTRGSSRVCNNLILGGERTLGPPLQWDAAMKSWSFTNNWWERDDTTRPVVNRDERIAEFHDALNVPVRVGTSHPQFLVPAADSPLLTKGAGGDLPAHIGAKKRH